MKKKLLITLLALVATATYATVLTACNTENNPPSTTHSHSWSETYIEDGDRHYQTCSGCEEKNYADHSYTNGVCVCGKTELHTHAWSETYTEDIGRHYQTCSGCDKKNYSSHKYTDLVCTDCGRNLPVIVGTEGLRYELNEDKKSYSISSIDSATDLEIVISSVYEGLPVTAIGESVFYNRTNITSISIPESVNFIGKNAFFCCTCLTTITIPNSVTSIGNEAFYRCSSLANVTLPNSVTSIGYQAFWNCTSLTSITIPDSITHIDDTLVGCSSLTSIAFQGKVDKWNGIEKSTHWDYGTGNYIVYCTDGEIAKDGTATMY